jgi:hypothetical protein
MLRSFTVLDPHLVNSIRENPRYTKMTPEEILGKFVSGRMMIKEARYVDEALNGPMPIYEPQTIALKATSSREALPSKVAQVEATGLEKWFWRYFSRGKYMEIYRWNIWAVFLERTWRGSLGKYLGSISVNNLRGITGEIFVGYFEEDFREYRPLYFICWYQLANKHFEMKFEIHFEFRASLRKFQGLNFWDATSRLLESLHRGPEIHTWLPRLLENCVPSPEPIGNLGLNKKMAF